MLEQSSRKEGVFFAWLSKIIIPIPLNSYLSIINRYDYNCDAYLIEI